MRSGHITRKRTRRTKSNEPASGFHCRCHCGTATSETSRPSKAREEQAQASLLATQREVERRVTQSAATFETKREQIANWQADTVAKFREAAELADRHYRLGAVALPIYVETQKQYLEIVGALQEMKKDALQAAQELEILTGLKLYREEERP